MRMIFGLVGILVTVGVIILVLYFSYLPHAQSSIKAGNKAKAEVGQIAGIDTTTGKRVDESIKLEDETSGGKVQSILVTDILADGPMARMYGLHRNDSIVEIGTHGSLQKVRDMNDGEMAKALVIEAYQTSQSLVVVRDGQQITLEPGTVAAAAKTANANADKKPAESSDPLQRQLDTLQKIPTH